MYTEKINKNKHYHLYLLIALLSIATHVLGNNTPITSSTNNTSIKFKSFSQVNKGIANQLSFLIDYNNKESNNAKKWYVYVVGNDRFDTSILFNSDYVINQLDLTGIKTSKKLVNVDQLNKRLIEINASLEKKGQPLLYYGLANKKTAIPVPFFPFKGKYISSATTSELEEYYTKYALNNKGNAETEQVSKAAELLKAFFKGARKKESEELIQKTLEKSGGDGAVALSKYYYAFVTKETNTSSINIEWWSKEDILLGKDIEVNYKKLNKCLANQSSSLNSNYRRINAWHDYFLGLELPKGGTVIQIVKEMVNNRCININKEAFNKRKQKIENSVATGDVSKITKSIRHTCGVILGKLSYETIIKAIITIAKKRITEEGEAVIIRLLHHIKVKDYDKLFTDLKDNYHFHETLLVRLLSEVDNHSIYPFDNDNYTSFLGELLYIGSQNRGEYLKKERVYLVNTFLEAKYQFSWPRKSIAEGISKILSFNIDENEEKLASYLTRGGYGKLIHIIDLFTYAESEAEHSDQLGTALGKFFAAKNNQEIYVKLLEYSLANNVVDKTDPFKEAHILEIVFSMLKSIPKNSNQIYKFLTTSKLHNLKKVINYTQQTRDKFIPFFYNGIGEVFNKNNDYETRIALAKWAIEQDQLGPVHEKLVASIFTNVGTNKEKQLIYDFLTYKDAENKIIKDYYYFFKLTSTGVLSGNIRISSFVSFYTQLISEGFGDVNDRINILNEVVKGGDDTIFYNDTEAIVSHIFDNMSTANFGEVSTLLQELKSNRYELFYGIWKILEKANINELFNTDNKYATNFIQQISTIMKLAYGESTKDLPYSVKKALEVDYLATTPSALKPIKIKDTPFFPMARAGVILEGLGYQANSYDFEANIVAENKKVAVAVSLNIGGKSIVEVSDLDPLQYVIVQFIADTKITEQTRFKKGDIIAVPAMYLAWMDNMIDGAQNDVIARVVLDGVVIIGSVATVVVSGGTSLAMGAELLAGAELIFATTDVAIAIYEDELKATLGNDFVEGYETVNLILGVASLPSIGKGIVSIAKKSGKVIIKSGGGKFISKISQLKSLKGYKIKVDYKLLFASLKKLKNTNPKEFEKQLQLAVNALDRQRLKISNMRGDASKSVKNLYKNLSQYVAKLKKFNISADDIITSIKKNVQLSAEDIASLKNLSIDDLKLIHKASKLKYRSGTVTFDMFEKTMQYNSTILERAKAYELWGKKKWGDLYDFFHKDPNKLINGGWPPFDGFEYIRHKNLIGNQIQEKLGTVIFDRFQTKYKGKVQPDLGGGFASPVNNSKYNQVDNVFTYDARALMDDLEYGTYYIKFRLKRTKGIVFDEGPAIPWKTKAGKEVIGGASQVKIKNKKFNSLIEGDHYDIVQKSKLEGKKWIHEIEDTREYIDKIFKNNKLLDCN